MMSYQAIIAREVILQWRTLRRIVNAGLFFLMVLVLFPLGFEANPILLKKILPGLVWIAALFSFFLGAEAIFQQENEDGVLEQWLLSAVPMHMRIRIKLCIHWLSLIIFLMCVCFLIALLFDLNGIELGVLILSLVCGTPTLYALCAFSAAFGLGLNNQGLFSALIVLPLMLPVIIFGGGVLTLAIQGLPVSGHLAWLLAMSILSFWGLPYAISAVIRIGVADVSR
ncbi:MAG: heme exporter protein CcmB [Gammaproteobacteria bacterium]|nr:heme exporter protein CcmB [Gammaproteobacteria bacterium]MCH9763001.1 heme exporter protein CcmB [Gammaproteobacteria bacterium]